MIVPSLGIHIRSALVLCLPVQQLLLSSPEMMRWLTRCSWSFGSCLRNVCDRGCM